MKDIATVFLFSKDSAIKKVMNGYKTLKIKICIQWIWDVQMLFFPIKPI